VDLLDYFLPALQIMLVLIDESGDCGLKFDKGSSKLFVCVAVIFSDAFSADACDRSISCLKHSLKKPPGFEFHFSNCSDKLREEFLKTVAHENFTYAGFVVEKRKLYGPRFKEPKGSMSFLSASSANM
jgi:hypothetical protein